MGNTRWTEEEDAILVQEVSRSINNLRNAFISTAIITHRTPRAVTLHWYRTVKNKETIFMTVGKKTLNTNTKNVFRGSANNTIEVHESLWNRILGFLGLR